MLWNWAMENFGGNRIALQDLSGYRQPPEDEEAAISGEGYQDEAE